MNSLNYNDYIFGIEHFCNLSRYLSNNYPLIIKNLGLYNNEIFLEETFSIRKKKREFTFYLELRTNEHGLCHVHIYEKGCSDSFAKIILDKKPTSLQEIIGNIILEYKNKKLTDYIGINDFLTFLVETWLDLPYKSKKVHDEHSKYAIEHNLTNLQYIQYKWPFILESSPSSNTNNNIDNNKRKNKKKR